MAAAIAAVAAMGGCAGEGGPRARAAAAAAKPAAVGERGTMDMRDGENVVLEIVAPARVALGERATAAVRVENRLDRPILLVSLALRSGEKSVAKTEPPPSFPARREAEGRLVIEGTYRVEEIGPQARLPAPPRWDWMSGEETLVSAMLLRPRAAGEGGGVVIQGDFRPEEDADGRLTALATYKVLPAGTDLFVVGPESRSEQLPGPAPGAGFQAGWRAVARERLVLVRGGEPGEGGAASPPAGGAGGEIPPTLRIFPHLVRQADFDALPAAEARAERIVEVLRPAFDIAAARERCGLASGPALYLPPAGAWVLEGAGRSCVVSAGRSVEVRGSARALAEALLASDAATVTLFSGAPAPDAAALAAFAAFDAHPVQEKGGTTGGVARVTAASLFDFLAALARRGEGLEGLRVVR
jgi:hypothetical protein